ncbi:MAG TPA: hypothetical protein VFS19_01980 [Planctomycetota bacterium]|nr:hypothetical protein [Planctomycetota bacterium]
MATDPERTPLEKIWAEVRSSFLEYRLDDLRRILDVPVGAPAPNRAQARQFAEALPDLGRARFLKIVTVGDWAAYYGQSGRDVFVIRFRKSGSGWKPAQAPHTLSSYSTDEKIDAEALISREPSLRPVPGEPAESPAPPPAGEPQDARPEAEIRRDLVAVSRRIRDAFAAGRPERASADLLLEEGAALPSPDEAKAFARDRLPDLVRGQFLKLGWRADKPQLVGYYVETKVGTHNQSTVSLVAFVRHEGRWKFAAGPASIATVEGPKVNRAGLLKLIDSDPRLAL